MSRNSKLKKVSSLPFEGPLPSCLFASSHSVRPVAKPQICWRITKRPPIPDQAIAIIKELESKQQFPIVTAAAPIACRTTQATCPIKGTTSDYYTGSHSDSSIYSTVHHSDSFNATKESDESITMSVNKLELDENTAEDVNMSCHDEGESCVLSAVSCFEEEEHVCKAEHMLDKKEAKNSQKMLSKEFKEKRKHSPYTEEEKLAYFPGEETRLSSARSSVKQEASELMPPLKDGKDIERQKDCMAPLENGLDGKEKKNPKKRKSWLEKLNELEEEEKSMNAMSKEKGKSIKDTCMPRLEEVKSRTTDFCQSPWLKGSALETRESQIPPALNTLTPTKPAYQSPQKSDQELGTKYSSTFSTPKPTKSAHHKPKLAASFYGAQSTVDSNSTCKPRPSTCPAVQRSRSAIPRDTQETNGAHSSTPQLSSLVSSSQQNGTSPRVLEEQIRSMEQKIGAMENELSELLSNSEEDLPSWDEERLSTLDQFIQLKTKAGMKAKFIQERSAVLSKYKQHFTSTESDLKLKHSTLQTEERALRTVLQLYYS